MRKLLSCLFVGLLSCLAMGQELTLRFQDITLDPSNFTSGQCVQIGAYIENTGATTYDLNALTLRVMISDPQNLIAGSGVDENMIHSQFMQETTVSPGLASPFSGFATAGITADALDACNGGFNPVTEATQGSDPAEFAARTGTAPFLNAYNNNGGGDQGIVVTAGSGMVTMNPGDVLLIMVLQVPIVDSPGNGKITVTYNVGDVDITGARAPLAYTLPAGYEGEILVFDTADCTDAGNFVVATDNTNNANTVSTSGGSTASLGIDYLNPTAPSVDLDVNYEANVSMIQVVGNDGYDSGQVAVDGTSPDTFTVSPTNQDTEYTITYFVPDVARGGDVPGTPCTVDVSMNATSCTLNWTNNGIGGANSVLTLTLTNAEPSGGVWAEIDVPDGATGLADPIQVVDGMITGNDGTNTITFEVINQSIPDGSWAGNYSVSGNQNFAGTAGTGCSDSLGFVCPTNNATLAGQGTIGGTVTVNLTGDDALDWDITYNGVTTNVPGDTATFDVTPITGNATTITVVANGVGPDAQPCSDTVVLPIDYVAPSCTSATQNPDSTVTPVDVGTVITLTLVTEGATSASINGTPMTPTAGTPGTDNQITWEATYTAVADEVVTADIENPDGEGDSGAGVACQWTIDINCIEPTLVSVGEVGRTGVTVSGTDGCTYTVTVVDFDGNVVDQFNVTVGAGGLGTDNTWTILPDVYLYVGQLGQTVTSGPFLLSVPTLGEWAMIAFIGLLMIAGLGVMRRRGL